MTLAESKEILKQLQANIVSEQVTLYLETRRACPDCGTSLRTKGSKAITFRTRFGNRALDSPRLRHCSCQPRATQTFSPLTGLLPEHTAPELLFMESQWASLVSYGLTVKALQDFLPIDEKLNETTVRNHTMAVAERCESELGDEQVFFIDGCPREWEALPPPDGPITVGMDGGYVRDWENKKTNFEVIVGKSVPTDGAAKCFGFVQTYDSKPKRRLFEVLQSQGMQMNVESLVNSFLSKRFAKKQQMQWTKRGAHLLLQTRAKVVNDELEIVFRTWYPNFRSERKVA